MSSTDRGCQFHFSTLPLIELDGRFSRIRLSEGHSLQSFIALPSKLPMEAADTVPVSHRAFPR